MPWMHFSSVGTRKQSAAHMRAARGNSPGPSPGERKSWMDGRMDT